MSLTSTDFIDQFYLFEACPKFLTDKFPKNMSRVNMKLKVA